MTSNHFVVSQRDSVWQFSYRGDVTGPFTTRQAAIDAAIAAAAGIEDADVEVMVRDADLRSETVWRTGQPGLTQDETGALAAELERNSDA